MNFVKGLDSVAVFVGLAVAFAYANSPSESLTPAVAVDPPSSKSIRFGRSPSRMIGYWGRSRVSPSTLTMRSGSSTGRAR